MEKIVQYYSCGVQMASRVGFGNIAFFGLVGTAVGIKYIIIDLVFSWKIQENHTMDFTCLRG